MANEFRKVTDQNGVDHPVCDDNRVDWSSYAVLGAKNLLPNTAKSGTAATNVNYIVNSDGSITANGTPAGDDVIAVNTTGYFLTTDDIGKNETILTGAPTGSSATTYCLVAIIRPKTGGSATNLYFDYGEGVKVRALTDTERLEVRINLITGKQLDNKTFYPMLRLATDPDSTYQPHAMTNGELTDKVVVKNDIVTLSQGVTAGTNKVSIQGNVVDLFLYLTNITLSASDDTIVGTIPYIPVDDVGFFDVINAAEPYNQIACGFVRQTGQLVIKHNSTISSITSIYIKGMYICK